MTAKGERFDPNRQFFIELVALDNLVTKYLFQGGEVDSYQYDHAEQSWKPLMLGTGILSFVHRFNNNYFLTVHNYEKLEYFKLAITVHIETIIYGHNLLLKRLDNHTIYRFQFKEYERLFKFDMNVMLIIQHLKMEKMLKGLTFDDQLPHDMIKIYFLMAAKAKHFMENANKNIKGECPIPLEWQTHRRSLDLKTFLLLNETSRRSHLSSHFGRGSNGILSSLSSVFSRDRTIDFNLPDFFLSTQGINTLNAFLQYLLDINNPNHPNLPKKEKVAQVTRMHKSKTTLGISSFSLSMFRKSRDDSHYSLILNEDAQEDEKEEQILEEGVTALYSDSHRVSPGSSKSGPSD